MPKKKDKKASPRPQTIDIPSRQRPLPFRWFFQEEFWRDVFVNLMSAGLLTGAAYIAALSTGYLDLPTLAGALGILALFLGLLVGMPVFLTYLDRRFYYQYDPDHTREEIRQAIRVDWSLHFKHIGQALVVSAIIVGFIAIVIKAMTA